MGVSKESISKFLIGNRFHVKLRILSPYSLNNSLNKDWGCVIIHEIDFLLKICWSIPCLHPSRKVHSWIEICASLNHRKKTKADGSWLIPRKQTEKLVLLSVNKIHYPTPVKTEIITPAPAPGPVFIQKSDSSSCSGFGKNRRLLPESIPAPWSPLSTTKQAKHKICVHLDHRWNKIAQFFVCKRSEFVHQELRDFVKMTLIRVSSHWLWLESSRVILRKTWLECSRVPVFLNVTRFESDWPNIMIRVEELTRIMLSLIDCDSSHSAKNVPRVDSSNHFFNLTRVELESPKIETEVESLTRATLWLLMIKGGLL